MEGEGELVFASLCVYSRKGGLRRWKKNKSTFREKIKIAVKALTQKPSVLTPPLTEGEPATLTCTAPGICSGTPPNITWTWRGTGDNITELRDNTTIQKREDLTSVTTTHFSTLTFTPSAQHHTTKVTCQVTFKGNITTEETVTLNVTQEVSKDILAMLLKPTTDCCIAIGAAFSAPICCIFCVWPGKCKDGCRTGCAGRTDPSTVVLMEGAENTGPQTSGAEGNSAKGKNQKMCTTPLSTTPN
ncbi:sialic acid-binding Ig-like lectin 14 [Salmo trutta]|uniref:sialic acid-binding Ig-like lectin 14 n=1 Tax=Salmo trutta TaxID=8032 RepID=UPI00113243A0|nr:sialic acid-binding Ig-like lectin 14 [Salmo trutta]